MPMAARKIGDATHCSVKEAAVYAGCSIATIKRWIAQGRLEAKRPVPAGSSRLRVNVASLRALVETGCYDQRPDR